LLALRSWLRYVVPLTLLSVVAFAPIALYAVRVATPVDANAAKATVKLGYELVAVAWWCQLVLVAAAAAAIRAVATGDTPTQLVLLGRGLRRLIRAVVPCAIAACAIGLGGLALVVPGVLLLLLFALTGASTELAQPVPAPLVDAVAVARRALGPVAAIVVAMLVLDAAIPILLHTIVVAPIPPKGPALEALASARLFVQATAAALVALSPIAALLLATVYDTITRRTAPAPAAPPPAPTPS
jgi:hypothetical protein